jgi:UDP-N-acetylmuramate--alanine ligase
MVKTINFQGQPFHFIGIGGIGMSALAQVLAERQLPVSGSDTKTTHITERLRSLGVRICAQQTAGNLDLFQSSPQALARTQGVGTAIAQVPDGSSGISRSGTLTLEPAIATLPQVICSTAIAASNPEYQAAKERGCTIFHRSDVLAAFIDDYQSIAIAGTHGKTTTSSLIGYLLLKANLDPTIIVGGEVAAWDGNARLGQGQYLVAEADESDGSLVKHAPYIGVVTNIELDHPDHYESLADVVAIFKAFERNSQIIVACWDCATVRSQIRATLSYSLDPKTGADYAAVSITPTPEGNRVVVLERGQQIGEMIVPMLGLHNVSNALAAVAVGRYLGVDFVTIAEAIATFTGAKRRFERRGEWNQVTFIDDYAHHPSEIEATLQAARQAIEQQGAGRVIALFQPHRYSRTAAFLEEFATAFSQADQVFLTDIYSAGEVNLHNLTGQALADAVAQHHPAVIYQPDPKQLPQQISPCLQPYDLVLFLGAGNLNQTIPEALATYRTYTTSSSL